mmetsp:Transcript_5017/g.7085  ORF Transcript_5017/g.7085 Transcript_5017/m.7085 type:complete len:85 (-) Transcript_5017:118-372(-)
MLVELFAALIIGCAGGSAAIVSFRECRTSRQAREIAETETAKLYIMIRELNKKRHLTAAEKSLCRLARREIKRRLADDEEPYSP